MEVALIARGETKGCDASPCMLDGELLGLKLTVGTVVGDCKAMLMTELSNELLPRVELIVAPPVDRVRAEDIGSGELPVGSGRLVETSVSARLRLED